MFKPFLVISLTALLSAALANPMQPDRAAPAPAQPVATARAAPPALPRLQSIIIIGDLRKAVFLPDQEIALGEQINGYRLVELDSRSVTLQRGSITRTLTITTSGEFTLQPANEE